MHHTLFQQITPNPTQFRHHIFSIYIIYLLPKTDSNKSGTDE